jgi:choice-of-anchor A domain-containing protein
LCPDDPANGDIYQALFFGDFCMRNSDVQGRLAVGGHAEIIGSGIGDRLYPSGVPDQCPNPDSIDYSLVVGGGLSISNSKVYFGGIAYGSDDGILINLDGSIGRNCPFTQGQVHDFAALHTGYRDISASMATLSANAVSQIGDGGNSFYLFLDNTLDVVVFQVNAADLEAVSAIKLVGSVKSSTTSIIINVVGATSFTMENKGLLEKFSTYAQLILWNFSGFTSISIGSTQWLGSILAPDATFFTIAGGAEVHGSVYGWSLACNEGDVATMQFDQFPFLGTFYVPCPGEPEYQCP